MYSTLLFNPMEMEMYCSVHKMMYIALLVENLEYLPHEIIVYCIMYCIWEQQRLTLSPSTSQRCCLSSDPPLIIFTHLPFCPRESNDVWNEIASVSECGQI